MSTAKYNGWQNLPTIQSKEILTELLEAKEDKKALMLIADTGVGKSNSIKMFQQKKPKHTYVITLGDTYGLIAVLNELQLLLGLPVFSGKNSKHSSLRQISKELNRLAEDGADPIIILDEAENAKIQTLKAIKQLYDAVADNCSIVMIGTHQLTDALNRKSFGQSIPQLRRRFKAGTRLITAFNKAKDMKPFFDLYIPKEPDLQDLLIELCDNYGELHDYLHRFLHHCDKRNVAPTEQNFRLYHKIPKRK
ncbi:MAG: AAA family ATPase [Bacteroidota bacterium]